MVDTELSVARLSTQGELGPYKLPGNTPINQKKSKNAIEISILCFLVDVEQGAAACSCLGSWEGRSRRV